MSGIIQSLIGSLKSAAATVSDAYFNLTTLLLNTSSTNGAQNNTFLDSSSSPLTITRNGNTTQGTFTPFSQTGWSNNMTTGYLTTAANAGFALSGDFTVECWVFSGDSSLDASARRRIFHTGGGDISNSLQLLLGTSAGNSAVISVLNSGFLIDGTINVVTNSWVHIAVTRSGTSLKLFVNGVQSGSTATTSQNFNSGTSNTVYIGANSSGNGIWQGYISNLRVIVGTAIYTSAFTPPTAPFATGTTNQQLLICASNRFADINTATSAKTITVVTTPSVQAFSPFAPTAAYDTAVVGGSGYFDGSGDYLTGPSASGGDFGSGNFTISFWYYPVSNANYGLLSYADTGGWNGWQIQQTGSNTIKFEFLSGSTGDSSITGGTVYANQWNYVVITRSGSTVTLYTNSTSSAGTSTNSSSYGVSGSRVIVGNERSVSPGTPLNGYLSNVKLVKQANAPASIPTAPDTNTTNTSFLLNFTNSGIFDSTAKNVLETVGNAQVSTTQAKWGTTSMYFDGTGDYLKAPYTPNIDFGTGDFTIECWVYTTNTSPGYSQTVIARQGNTGGVIWIVQILDGGTSRIALTGGNTATGTTVAANTWTHIAFTRSGTSLRAFNNGVLIQTTTDSTSLSGTQILSIGGQSAGESPFIGYMDDIRITKGYARYTATFTPPAAAFPIQ
jgi:hypothetical protein